MTPLPRRLKLSRRKGFNLQALSREVNGLPAVNCARPGKWGNRWKIGDVVQEFGAPFVCRTWTITTAPEAAAAHRQEYLSYFCGLHPGEKFVRDALDRDLRGRNLACWCDLCAPCHCDDLLVLANAPSCDVPVNGESGTQERQIPMALHEQSVGASDEWYTPSHVFEALGALFDMDVASPGRAVTPWIPAINYVTSDGLSRPWSGYVWMNPPFGARNAIVPWLAKFFDHGNGIALTPDRTSAPWWQEFAPRADAVLFVARKIRFIAGFDDPDGNFKRGDPGKSPAQGTCLMAAGPRAVEDLCRAQAAGLGFLMSALGTVAIWEPKAP